MKAFIVFHRLIAHEIRRYVYRIPNTEMRDGLWLTYFLETWYRSSRLLPTCLVPNPGPYSLLLLTARQRRARIDPFPGQAVGEWVFYIVFRQRFEKVVHFPAKKTQISRVRFGTDIPGTSGIEDVCEGLGFISQKRPGHGVVLWGKCTSCVVAWRNSRFNVGSIRCVKYNLMVVLRSQLFTRLR